jgi:hypothetical protein
VELLLMQDEQVIETLAPYTAEKAFTEGIGSRGVIGGCEYLDATRVGDPSEARSNFALVIPDEVFRSLSIRCGFSQVLRNPGVCRSSCDAHMDHFARAQEGVEESRERTEK